MSNLPVSVVIVSRGRASALKRCLTGISQLQYPNFEAVVVADPEGVRAARAMPFADDLKLVGFDEANISAARNLGLCHAAGEVIAFIDDDAVPEPQWLYHLVAPATYPNVAAMGGYVRGRNGISFQWRGRSLDRMGESHPLDLDLHLPTVLHPPKGRAVKTEGTNMAFRREVLIELGGFDPAFHYFLDETDLNMRLAQAGHATAIVPLAEVHHGFAANALRAENRMPTDLYDIGASWAVFHRKHVPQGDRTAHWQRLRMEQRARLLRYLVSGPMEPARLHHLMRRLDAGYADGRRRPIVSAGLPVHPVAPFHPFPVQRRIASVILSNPMALKRDQQRALERVANGEIVTLYSISGSTLFHRVSFHPNGYWLQRGGLYGKVARSDRLFTGRSPKGLLETECRRVAKQRGLGEERIIIESHPS